MLVSIAQQFFFMFRFRIFSISLEDWNMYLRDPFAGSRCPWPQRVRRRFPSAIGVFVVSHGNFRFTGLSWKREGACKVHSLNDFIYKKSQKTSWSCLDHILYYSQQKPVNQNWIKGTQLETLRFLERMDPLFVITFWWWWAPSKKNLPFFCYFLQGNFQICWGLFVIFCLEVYQLFLQDGLPTKNTSLSQGTLAAHIVQDEAHSISWHREDAFLNWNPAPFSPGVSGWQNRFPPPLHGFFGRNPKFSQSLLLGRFSL